LRPKPGEFLRLKNLRLHPGEETDDSSFFLELASLEEIYVSDVFGVLRRKHASSYGAAQLLREYLAGFLVRKAEVLEIQVGRISTGDGGAMKCIDDEGLSALAVLIEGEDDR
jgi:3-phosphoglycerate kinase